MSFSEAYTASLPNGFAPEYLPGQSAGSHGTFENPIRELYFANGNTQYFAIMQPDPLQFGYSRGAQAAIADTLGWSFSYTYGGMAFSTPYGRPALYKQFDMSNVSNQSIVLFKNDSDDTVLAAYHGTSGWTSIGPYDTDGGANSSMAQQNTQYLRKDDPDDGATADNVIRMEWGQGQDNDYIILNGPNCISKGAVQYYEGRADGSYQLGANLENLFFKMVNSDYTNLYNNEEVSSSPPYQSFVMGFSEETKPANGFT
jgi:hypothetical protein